MKFIIWTHLYSHIYYLVTPSAEYYESGKQILWNNWSNLSLSVPRGPGHVNGHSHWHQHPVQWSYIGQSHQSQGHPRELLQQSHSSICRTKTKVSYYTYYGFEWNLFSKVVYILQRHGRRVFFLNPTIKVKWINYASSNWRVGWKRKP